MEDQGEKYPWGPRFRVAISLCQVDAAMVVTAMASLYEGETESMRLQKCCLQRKKASFVAVKGRVLSVGLHSTLNLSNTWRPNKSPEKKRLHMRAGPLNASRTSRTPAFDKLHRHGRHQLPQAAPSQHRTTKFGASLVPSLQFRPSVDRLRSTFALSDSGEEELDEG